jgi:nicotinamide-nucleotide adenylyltransferase
MGRALIVGRFQPFHLGHLELVKKAAAEYDGVVVAIGSAQESHTSRNPFTAGERVEMVTAALREAGLDEFFVIPVEDVHRHAIWVSHVVALCPRFEAVLANEPLTTRLFEEAGFKVVRTELFSRKEWSATEVRRRMVAGEDWRSLVPRPVAAVMDSMKGAERVAALARGDTA